MKKISFKIILAIVISSSALLIASGIVTFSAFSNIIEKDALEELGLIINEESINFTNETKTNINAVKALKGLVINTIDTNQIGDPDYIDKYKKILEEQMLGISKGMELISLYFYIIPEIDPLEQISIDDYDGDGVYERGVATNLLEADLKSSDNDWYSMAISRGSNWTHPYYWEDAGSSLISYTESLVIKGKVVGVIGTDIMTDNIIERFNSVKILNTGSITLFDNDLNFLFDEEFIGKSLKTVDPPNYERIKKRIKDKKGFIDYTFKGVDKILFFSVMNNGWIITSGIEVSEVFEELNKLRLIFIIIILVGVFISGAIALFIGRSISKPIKSISNSMKELSSGEGDLTKTITVESRDETALLAENFNIFIDKLKFIVSNIKQSSLKSMEIGKSLTSSSATASSASVQISSNVASIEGQISKLNNLISDTTSGTEEIGANITQFKNQISEQVSAVEESSASIEEMIASLENVATVTNKKLESTKRLVSTTKFGEGLLAETSSTFKEGIADRIGNIKDMVDVITNISARTNLLAMNAAIEAAHAGDAGKGFAVVADEIRKMAEEASGSSQAISDIIKVIISAIENTDSNVDKTSNAFKDIYTEVNEIDTALNEIASNTVELASGGQEILKAVSLLNDTTAKISQGIGEIEVGSDGITEAMGNVQHISSEVYEGVQEISNGVKEVSESFDVVSKMAHEIDDESNNLSDEVNRFIID